LHLCVRFQDTEYAVYGVPAAADGDVMAAEPVPSAERVVAAAAGDVEESG
jgi:hypothetical protein